MVLPAFCLVIQDNQGNKIIGHGCSTYQPKEASLILRRAVTFCGSSFGPNYMPTFSMLFLKKFNI
jgi:hypothetical protein